MRAERSSHNPIIYPGMPGLSGEAGSNINGPSVIRVPEWIPNRLGTYYLYFAHHRGTFIRMAYADALDGPWTVYAPGTLQLHQTACVKEVASPDVHVDEKNRCIRVYFHGKYAPNFIDKIQRRLYRAGLRLPQFEVPKQVTYAATSGDGIHFTAERTVLGPYYFRVFEYGGYTYALARSSYTSAAWYRSKDGISRFEKGREILPNMRHAAVLRRGDELSLFYSVIGSSPEQIIVSRVDLSKDWNEWIPSEPEIVLFPETAYEGAHLPLVPSMPGPAWEAVRELRDPAIFEENGQISLFYSVAGERGIARAILEL